VNSGTFRPGQSGNPAGKPKGAKDRVPRNARAAVERLLETIGADTRLISRVLKAGLNAKAPASFPYLRLVIEQNAGLPDQAVTVQTQVIHEHRSS